MLTAAACLALVGTASAAWVYAGTATESANIGVKVASYASAGEITVTGADNLYLYLDNGSVTWMKKDETVNLVATHTIDSNLSEEGKTTTLTYFVILKGELAKLVKFSDENLNQSYTTDDSLSFKTYRMTHEEIAWNSGAPIALPALAWDTDGTSTTYDKAYTDETKYKELISSLNGTGVGDSWDKNQDIDVGKFVEIRFKAAVN